jgi:hypothetical protein
VTEIRFWALIWLPLIVLSILLLSGRGSSSDGSSLLASTRCLLPDRRPFLIENLRLLGVHLSIITFASVACGPVLALLISMHSFVVVHLVLYA